MSPLQAFFLGLLVRHPHDLLPVRDHQRTVPMTDLRAVLARLAEIEQAAQDATPGRWIAGRTDMQSYDIQTGEAFTNVYCDNPRGKLHMGEPLAFRIARAFDDSGNNKADAAFIAGSRQWVPELCALGRYVESLEQRVQELEAMHHDRTVVIEELAAKIYREGSGPPSQEPT